jgi:hypothetical protein
MNIKPINRDRINVDKTLFSDFRVKYNALLAFDSVLPDSIVG